MDSNKIIKRFAESAYVLGILLLSLGTALMATADFGVSVIVAPAYIISLKVEFLTFGMSEYILQASLLIVMCLIIRRFRMAYIFSFITAFLYGCVLDIWMKIISYIPMDGLTDRLVAYVIGFIVSATGVALLIHTYLAPEVYELFVKELSSRFAINFVKLKIIYDCASCIVSFVMSHVLFGGIRGIGIGSVICAVLNGILISFIGKILEKFIDFSPVFSNKVVSVLKVSELKN